MNAGEIGIEAGRIFEYNLQAIGFSEVKRIKMILVLMEKLNSKMVVAKLLGKRVFSKFRLKVKRTQPLFMTIAYYHLLSKQSV